MIDTDKYEGHTPAPWDKLSEYCPVGSIDKQLIADAPLLLEEVKRLREVNDELQGDREQFIERSAEDEAGLKDELEATEAEVKRLRSGMQDILVDFETTKTDMWSIIKRIQEMIE